MRDVSTEPRTTRLYIRNPTGAKFRAYTSFVERSPENITYFEEGRRCNIRSFVGEFTLRFSRIIESRVNRTHKSTAGVTWGYVGRRRGNRIIIKYLIRTYVYSWTVSDMKRFVSAFLAEIPTKMPGQPREPLGAVIEISNYCY